MPDYSSSANREIHKLNADNLPVTLLEIKHPQLPVPVRIVQDRQDITVEANVFTALAFSVSLPTDLQRALPRAKLAIDNVSKLLTQWLEDSNGGRGTTVRILQVLRSDTATIEFDITMSLTNISVTPTVVQGDLGFDDLLNLPAVSINYTPKTSPGLF